jgi:hypothetical protein
MGYRIVAEVAMVVHFAFLVYVVVGGYLAWRWPRAFWPHLVAAGWGLLVTVVSIPCPLTYVENWGRRMAGEQGVAATGFIDHYIEGVIYPERYTTALQALAAASVAISWLVAGLRRRAVRRAESVEPGRG